jgi:hypothetical protein
MNNPQRATMTAPQVITPIVKVPQPDGDLAKSAPGRFGGYCPTGRGLRRGVPHRGAPREAFNCEFGRNGQMRGRPQSRTPADYMTIRDAIDSGTEAAVRAFARLCLGKPIDVPVDIDASRANPINQA